MQVDYIYWDLIATALWVAVLLWRRRWRALFFGICVGVPVYYFVDYVVWYRIAHNRHTSCSVKPGVLLLWVNTTPPILGISWGILTLERLWAPAKNRKKPSWLLNTIFMFAVQVIPAFISKASHIDDRECKIWRTMAGSGNRYAMLLAMCIGYSYLVWRRIPINVVKKIFLIGIGIEGTFELALFLSGIRRPQESLTILIVDSILEFNCGMWALFLLWRWTYKPHERPFFSEFFPFKAAKHLLYDGEVPDVEEVKSGDRVEIPELEEIR